jgi:hypothetical protein
LSSVTSVLIVVHNDNTFSLNLLYFSFCQGTPAVVLTRESIRASALNKGSSSDPGAWSIVGRAKTRCIRYIYLRPQQITICFGLTADVSGIKVWVIPLQLCSFCRYLYIVNTSMSAPIIIPAMAWDHTLSIKCYLS